METLCPIPIRAVIVLEVEPQRADRSAWCLPLRTAGFPEGAMYYTSSGSSSNGVWD